MAINEEVTDKPKSKYTIENIPGGFVVRREGNHELVVAYEDTYIHVGHKRLGLYCYPQMVDAIAEYFLDAVVSRYLSKSDRKEAVAMIARALSRRIKPHWQHLIEFVPPEISHLARLMWSSVHTDAAILHRHEIYAEGCIHLYSDLKKYHACRLIAKAEEKRIDPHFSEERHLLLIESVKNWRQLYAENVTSPKAFNKTLDTLPHALSFHDISSLANVHLVEPISSRLHMIAVLCGADHFHWFMHERLVLQADDAMLKAAGDLVEYRVSARSKTAHVRNLITFVLDYPAPFGGDFLGLARRSLEWHRENYIHEDVRLPFDAPLPLLNLDYTALEAQGVKPLRMVGDVVREGEWMHHCVGSYARRAYLGHSFLFHVEHKEDKATIELDAQGRVQQAYGPRNTINTACKWGVEQLMTAAKNLKVEVVPVIPF